MGLSNEERRNGIYWSLYRIDKIIREWDQRKEKYPPHGTEEIRALVGKLWHAFLCDVSNSLHWFMGSSTDNTIHSDGGSTPWEIAIINHCAKVHKAKTKTVDDFLDPDREKPFDATKMLSIPYLVTQSRDWAKGIIFQIYQEMENIIYNLRRYNDDFMEGYAELNTLVSKIMGACFTVFADEEDYAKAYLIHEMLHKIYGPRYPYGEENWDIVTQIMSKHNVHHDFTRLMKWKLEDIAVHHIALVKAYVAARTRLGGDWIKDTELLQLRMFLVCELAHSLHEFKHIRKEILDQLAGSVLDADVPALAILLEKKAIDFEEAKKERDKESDNKYRLNELNAYGYGGYHDIYEFVKGLKDQIPIPDPVPEPTAKKKKKKNEQGK